MGILIVLAIVGVFAALAYFFDFASIALFFIGEGAKSFAILIMVIIVLIFALKGCIGA